MLSPVLLTAPTSPAVYVGLLAAFAHPYTSLAGSEDGKSVICALLCVWPDGAKFEGLSLKSL